MILSKLSISTDFEEPIFVEYIAKIGIGGKTINIKNLILDSDNIFIYITKCYSFHYDFEHLKTDEVLIQQVYDDVLFKLSKAMGIYGYEIDFKNIKDIFEIFSKDY